MIDRNASDRRTERNAVAETQSPCIGVCVLSTAKVCQGCFRTSDEITGWSRCDDATKRQINQLAQQRKTAAQ
ncbi:MAG: DUF1289 domain-containing protein [Planctomycetota bacterium]